MKGYPEQASAKLAIVSYLNADDRFFPSTSFVVDPPTLPEAVEPDLTTSRLLHFEKVLQFAGFPETAKQYTTTLARSLRERRRPEEGVSVSAVSSNRLIREQTTLREQFSAENERRGVGRLVESDMEFIGHSRLGDHPALKVFHGVSNVALEAGVAFEQTPPLDARVTVSETEVTSIFTDGTMLRISASNGMQR